MNCNLCQDRGIVIRGEVAIACSCTRKRNVERLIRSSLLPKKFRDYTFDKFNPEYYDKKLFDAEKGISHYDLARIACQSARDFTARFLKNPNTDGLLFTGPVGSGKTFLACCIANSLLKKGQVVLFTVVPELLDQIRSTYDLERYPEAITEYDLVDTARQVPLLILDDLGAHNYTDWTINKIYSIINYRLNHQLPVIVTTNIEPLDLERYLGDRTTSRLLEMCRTCRLLVEIDIRAIRRKEKDHDFIRAELKLKPRY